MHRTPYLGPRLRLTSLLAGIAFSFSIPAALLAGTGTSRAMGAAGEAVAADGALGEITLTNAATTASPARYRFGYAFEKGRIPVGAHVEIRRIDGSVVPSAQCETNQWSDGSLRKATLVLCDGMPIPGGGAQRYRLYPAVGDQPASSFNPWPWIAAYQSDFTVEVTNHTGSLSAARPHLAFSLKAASAVATRREIQADTDRFVRVQLWQKVPGEEHLLCSFYVDFWLNDSGTAPVAIEWTPVLRLPFGVTNPFGVDQPREKHFYNAVVAHGTTVLDSRVGLAQAQHTSWASLRSADDGQHARKHWVDLGTAPMPSLVLQYSPSSLQAMMMAGYLPPYDLTALPSAPPSPTYVPLGANGHRGGGLDDGGAYPARGLISQFDAVAILRQDAASWRQARVAAQAGLAYYFDLADHRPVNGDTRLRRIPGPVKSISPTPSYPDLGAPISCTTDNRAAVDLLVTAANSPHGAANWSSCDEAHWPDPAYFMAFVEGERYLYDAVTGSWDFTKRYYPYNELAHDRHLFNYGRPGVPSTRYGQIEAFAQERFGWGIASLAHAFALMPDSDPLRPYLVNYTLNVRNFLRDSFAYFRQAQKDKGFIVPDTRGVGALWMNNFTGMAFYFLHRVAEPLDDPSAFKAMAEVSAKRTIDAWRYSADVVGSYRDLLSTDPDVNNVLPPDQVFQLLGTSVTGNRFAYNNPITPLTSGDEVFLSAVDGSYTNIGIPPGGLNIRRYVVNVSADGATFQLSRTFNGEAEVFSDNARLTGGFRFQAGNPATCAYPGSEWAYDKGENYFAISHAAFQMALLNAHPGIDAGLTEKVRRYLRAIPANNRWKWGFDAETLLAAAIPPAAFATWRAAHFTGADFTNDAVSGPDADPDRCGLTNLARYAFGLAARGPVANPVTVGTATSAGLNYLTLTFPRRAAATDLTYTLEASTDLATWLPVEGHTYTAGASSITAQDTVALGTTPRRFLRVRVTTP